MYRFYERETVDGKSVPTSGITRISEQAMEKHLHKVGVPTQVRAYTYRSRHDGIARTAVEVKGTEGSIRFGGFGWGYGGTGPAGLQRLFNRLNVPTRASEMGTWTSINKIQEHWRIDLTKIFGGGLILPEVPSRAARNTAA